MGNERFLVDGLWKKKQTQNLDKPLGKPRFPNHYSASGNKVFVFFEPKGFFVQKSFFRSKEFFPFKRFFASPARFERKNLLNQKKLFERKKTFLSPKWSQNDQKWAENKQKWYIWSKTTILNENAFSEWKTIWLEKQRTLFPELLY